MQNNDYKSIAFVIPYFGKIREDFEIWLKSCATNGTINWIIFTDDNLEDYSIPDNVKVIYISYEDMKKRIQNMYDFKIALDRPYKIVDYKVAYGDIFKNELEGYDFWGYCDMDLMWGDIRSFITNEILDKYEKIGFQGHSTIFRNTKENCEIYKKTFRGREIWRDVFTTEKICNFDEKGINGIYHELGIPFYSETVFDTLAQYRHNFIVRYISNEDKRNWRLVYIWKDGELYRLSALRNGSVEKTPVLYVHWQKRKMTVKNSASISNQILIAPNFVDNIDNDDLLYDDIISMSQPRWVSYLFSNVNKEKGLIKKLKYIKRFVKYNYIVAHNNEFKHNLYG